MTVVKQDRAAEIARMRRATEDYQALAQTVARISKALPNGVSLRSLSVFADAKKQIGRAA